MIPSVKEVNRSLIRGLKNDIKQMFVHIPEELLESTLSAQLHMQITKNWEDSMTLVNELNERFSMQELYGYFLGRNPLLWDSLDSLYDKNAHLYDDAFKKANYKYDFLNDSYIVEYKVRKALGIVAHAYQTNDFTILDTLMRASNKRFYRWVEQLPNNIVLPPNLSHFAFKDSERVKAAQDSPSLYYHFGNIGCILFYLVEQKRAVIWEASDWLEHLKVFDPTKERNNDYPVLESFLVLTRSQMNLEPDLDGLLWEELMKERSKFLGSLVKKDHVVRVYQLINRLFEDDVEEYTDSLKKWAFDILQNDSSKPHSLRDLVRLVNANSFGGANTDAIMHDTLTRDEVSKILNYSLLDTVLARKDWVHRFVYTLVIYVLAREVKKSRCSLLKEGSFVKDVSALLKLREDEYTKEVTKLQTTVQKLEEVVALKEESSVDRPLYETALQTNRDLEKRIRELEQELEQKEDHSKEVHALREYVFKQENEVGNVTEATELSEEQKELLRKQNIVVIGGHWNWISAMRKELPNVLYIDADSSGRDFSRIQQNDAHVFVHTKYNNHGNYYKVLRLLRGNKSRLHYIDVNNVNLVLSEMYRKVIE